MKQTLICVALTIISLTAMTQTKNSPRPLSPEEKLVIIDKGTERPFTGKYNKFEGTGTYSCRQCGAALYRSTDKFDSGCGWPSFDDEIDGAVSRTLDKDGRRTEITCAKCGGHLGHVFEGEGLTTNNIRHCVNSVSIEFAPAEQQQKIDTAIFAGGCFWGVEHLMQQQAGVVSVESGYIGGKIANPTYQQVSSGTTGHIEAVRVIYDPSKVSYETLTKLFFEIHDPTQVDRQGLDHGEQYRSEIFYTNPAQKATAQKLITTLKSKGYKVATLLRPATEFYVAEDYHQDYYTRKGTQPYCHSYTKRF